MQKRPRISAGASALSLELAFFGDRIEDRSADGLRGCLAHESHFKSDEETHRILLRVLASRPQPSEPFATRPR